MAQTKWHNIVHSEKVAEHMNKMWGDYGKFTTPELGVVMLTYPDNIDPTVLNSYMMGYTLGLDENFGDVYGVVKVNAKLSKALIKSHNNITQLCEMVNTLAGFKKVCVEEFLEHLYSEE